MRFKRGVALAGSLFLASCNLSYAQFTCTTNHSTLTIAGYTGPGGAVTIPATINGLRVVDIGNWAFFYCTNVTSIMVPVTVTNIGYCAFYFCTNLTDAAIARGVTTIGSSAFEQCARLREVAIPNTVTSIGGEAFYDCASLTSVTIPKSVASIGPGAFAGCASLGAIEVDPANAACASVDGVLFTRNGTTLMQYPAGSPATSYTIPNSVATIYVCAFYRCANLTDITIPKSVTSIGSYAFAGCSGLDAVNFLGKPPAADLSIFFSEENGYSVPGDAILNHVRTASSNSTNSPSIADINISEFPNFFKAMNPTNNPGPVTILCTGDSTMNSSQGAVESGYSVQAEKMMNWGGCVAGAGSGSVWGHLVTYLYGSSGAFRQIAPDTNWYSSYWYLPVNQSLTNVLFDGIPLDYVVYTNFDDITVAYIVGPNESTNILVQTLSGWQGAATTVATINASNANYGGAVTNIAISPARNFDARLLNSAAQTAHIVGFGCEAASGHNLVQINFAYGGQREMLWTNVQISAFKPIMRALNPALILFQNKNNTSNQLADGYANFIRFWSNTLPDADQLHIGTYQTTATNYDNLGTDTAIRAACLANRKPFVNLYYDMPSAFTMSNLDWFIDGVHLWPTTFFEGGVIWDKLFATLGDIDFSDVNYWNAPQTPRKTTAYYYAPAGWGSAYAGIPAASRTPAIRAVRAGARAVLSWPASAEGFVLEESSTTSSKSWTKSSARLSTNDGTISASVLVSGGHGYYRLRLP